LRPALVAILTALLLALPAASALAETPTDEVYSQADAQQQAAASVSTTENGSSGLPFSGLDVGIVALAGLGILGTGLAIRRATRTD
jgi:hypothetical protein